MEKQPNSRRCFVCGVDNPFGLQLKFYDLAPGEVQAEYTVPERYQGYPGVVHGGIVAAMLDEVTGRAFMGPVDAPRFMYTARLEVRYRKNVPVGQPLRILGHAGKNRRQTAIATGEIFGPEGDLLAEADVLLVNVPESVIENTNLDELGWKVYEDGPE